MALKEASISRMSVKLERNVIKFLVLIQKQSQYLSNSIYFETIHFFFCNGTLLLHWNF